MKQIILKLSNLKVVKIKEVTDNKHAWIKWALVKLKNNNNFKNIYILSPENFQTNINDNKVMFYFVNKNRKHWPLIIKW